MSEVRYLESRVIQDAVASMCVSANRFLPEDVKARLEDCLAVESSPSGREVLRQILDNARLAAQTGLPLCQDTGLAIFFAELGRDLIIKGATLEEAVTAGVRQGYAGLRKSVCHPFTRANSGDNTPAVLHLEQVPGSALRLSYLAKGGGSENMSRVTMLTPSAGWKGVKKFVLERMAEAGANPCPPVIIGVGVGSSFEKAPLLAKKALLLPLDQPNPDPALAALEDELLAEVNSLGIGPMGLGGDCTCLAVRLALAPCHIASLPLAVNIQCHSARHQELIL
ncbi:fumarate hydratase [Desulfovibrio sp. OttesenSCG-928-C14]|nr:fumarate hydratase [Desulfovibrio sp. OttesenSCG-928-C14]